MNIDKELSTRSQGNCELCGSNGEMIVYDVMPQSKATSDEKLHICGNCFEQIEEPEKMDTNHWRCLNDSMWSEVTAVQVMAWRMLNRLYSEGWPKDLLEMLYLDDESLKWAKATGESVEENDTPKHKDINGALLENGDTVTLTKSIDVKGTSLTAKRGTAVRRISLVTDNHEQIEGKVEGQQIIILTKFVKKAK